MPPCGVATCEVEVHAKGLCDTHYRRFLNHGDASALLTDRLDGASLAERLAAYADRRGGADACWPWTRATDSSGYGMVYVPLHDRASDGRKQERAHRAAWRLAHGQDVPEGLEVIHACDNRPCVNPAHLDVGSHARNMGEMSSRGRASRGTSNPRTKLTDADVKRARELRDQGWLQRDIASHFGVTPPYISRLLRGERRQSSHENP